MKARETAVFYAKRLCTGWYAIYVNGHKEWIDAARKSPDAVRAWIDAYCMKSKINSYAIVFDPESYKYYLEAYNIA